MRTFFIIAVFLSAGVLHADTIIPVPPMDDAGYPSFQQTVMFLSNPASDLMDVILNSDPNPDVPLDYLGDNYWETAGIVFNPMTGYDSALVNTPEPGLLQIGYDNINTPEPSVLAELLVGLSLLGIFWLIGDRSRACSIRS